MWVIDISFSLIAMFSMCNISILPLSKFYFGLFLLPVMYTYTLPIYVSKDPYISRHCITWWNRSISQHFTTIYWPEHAPLWITCHLLMQPDRQLHLQYNEMSSMPTGGVDSDIHSLCLWGMKICFVPVSDWAHTHTHTLTLTHTHRQTHKHTAREPDGEAAWAFGLSHCGHTTSFHSHCPLFTSPHWTLHLHSKSS
jgi:hypothetical protein